MKYFNFKGFTSILILINILLFSSCFQKKYKNFEIIEENYASAISLMKFEICSDCSIDSIHGIDLKFQIDYPTITDNGLKKYGSNCNSLQICTFLLDRNKNKIKNNKSDSDTLSGDFVCEEYSTNSNSESRIQQFFPFNKDNVDAGINDFYFLIEAYPINKEKDTAMFSQKFIIKRLSTKPDFKVLIKLKLNHPIVNKYAINVDGFELDTTKFNPHSCDFALFGSGYPDPFWSISARGVYNYSSPSFKNILKYDSVYTSGNFYLSESDKILLYVSDWDSFSKNDALGSIYLKPSEISHNINNPTILAFDWVKNFRITAIKK
jgi:hypothetical protein